MTIAHIGVGVFAIGVTVTQTYRVEKDIALKAGETATLQGYTFEFRSTREVAGPNYGRHRVGDRRHPGRQAGDDSASAEARLPRSDHAHDRVGHTR